MANGLGFKGVAVSDANLQLITTFSVPDGESDVVGLGRIETKDSVQV